MANKDIFVLFEYYADKTAVLDGSSKRSPTASFQNFYQTPQSIGSVDSDVASTVKYSYLAFDVDGFSVVEASSLGDLSINMAATGQMVDLSDTAVGGDRLVICSLYIQNVGQDAIHSSATLISRYIGTINSVSMTDESINWSVGSSITKEKAQIPTRRVSSDLIGRFEGR
jgi:hypothetical protein